MLEIAKTLLKDYEESKEENEAPALSLDEGVLRKVVNYCPHEISPVCSYFGGIVAQEVVKYTGKIFTPI